VKVKKKKWVQANIMIRMNDEIKIEMRKNRVFVGMKTEMNESTLRRYLEKLLIKNEKPIV